MVRLKLQLFAKLNTNTSIVDYLKSQGKDSSYTARKKMAQELGISNYSGTAQQNTQMLKMLKNGSTNTTSANTSAKPTNTSNVASTPRATAISGVDQHLVDKANSSYAQSSNVTNAQNVAKTDMDKYKELASKPFAASDAYNQAMQYTNQLLEQLSSGRTSYTDQIKDLMGQIQNREDFSYDMAEDTMFQNMLSSAMVSGQNAMQDTMGQASALSGGYASTYAQSVGNQAYNSYVQDAYASLPEYYNMALSAYQMEGEEMYNQLAMLNDADASEYQRMYDAWNTNFTNAQQMYQNEYGSWQDSINNAYNIYQTSQGYADSLYAKEYQKWADEVNNAMQYMNMQNSDYWANKNFIEQQRQHEADMAYKYSSLAQDKAQFEATMRQKDEAAKMEQEWKKYEYEIANEDGKSLGDPSDSQLKEALTLYNAGDEEEYNAFLGRMEYLGIDTDMITDYVYDFKKEKKPTFGGIIQEWLK